ncbi:MAG: hypothetical protein Dasosvirus13_5 [Dasosvirus sp.]|uniref:RING-type E3 ubiquitin transferase n=1 Tax=Dasosvirus sp. TaxID=2487764 RepID=A0A3G4ZW01_9VIRU|nr:MAG: hypothetical protein Dasosvirus13_5 [Dasosvirus sp.]
MLLDDSESGYLKNSFYFYTVYCCLEMVTLIFIFPNDDIIWNSMIRIWRMFMGLSYLAFILYTLFYFFSSFRTFTKNITTYMIYVLTYFAVYYCFVAVLVYIKRKTTTNRQINIQHRIRTEIFNVETSLHSDIVCPSVTIHILKNSECKNTKDNDEKDLEQKNSTSDLLGSDLSCSICLTNYVQNDNLGILDCTHRFHMDCITRWLDVNPSCPLCRQNVL